MAKIFGNYQADATLGQYGLAKGVKFDAVNNQYEKDGKNTRCLQQIILYFKR